MTQGATQSTEVFVLIMGRRHQISRRPYDIRAHLLVSLRFHTRTTQTQLTPARVEQAVSPRDQTTKCWSGYMFPFGLTDGGSSNFQTYVRKTLHIDEYDFDIILSESSMISLSLDGAIGLLLEMTRVQKKRAEKKQFKPNIHITKIYPSRRSLRIHCITSVPYCFRRCHRSDMHKISFLSSIRSTASTEHHSTFSPANTIGELYPYLIATVILEPHVLELHVPDSPLVWREAFVKRNSRHSVHESKHPLG